MFYFELNICCTNFKCGTALNTFHSMGGVQCFTPCSAIINNSDRIQKLNIFQDKTEGGLKSMIFQDLSKDVAEVINWKNNILMTNNCDTLWLVGKFCNMYDIPGCRGYHEQITRHKSVEKTKVLFLPFINAPPSDYTALKMAAQKAKDLQLQTTIVTFDQPLHIKGWDIVACFKEDSEWKNIIIRLGGFHTYVVFGLHRIYNGSVIYASNSVDKLLAGHAYAQAVRAHLLLQLE